jgi:hypothetical protein
MFTIEKYALHSTLKDLIRKVHLLKIISKFIMV